MKGLQVLNPWHFRRKSRQSLWPRTGHLPEKLPFSPFLSALRCFLIDVMLRTTLVSWEWLQWRPHSSCICSYRTHRQKNPETPTFWKRFRNNELLHGAHFWRFFLTEKTVRFFFPVCTCSPLTQCAPRLLQRRVSGLHRPARLILCRANIDASPKRKRTEDWKQLSPMYPAGLILKLGLT